MLFRKKSPPKKQDQILEKSMNDEEQTSACHVQDAESASEPEPGSPAADPESSTAAPEPELSPAEEAAAPATISQALLDIQEAGMTPEEAAEASKALAEENQKEVVGPKGKAASKPITTQKNYSSGRERAEKLVVIARFRWILLLVLSLASVLTWTGEAIYAHRPYQWYACGWLALTLLITLPTGRFLRLPTRSGLAALCWAATFFLGALYGPDEMIFRSVPAALSWAGLMTMILLWLGVAIWRKLGRYKVVDILLSVFVFYALLGPALALINSVTVGGALNLKFATLSGSPDFISHNLPWFLWPMSVMVGLMLPLAALFSLGDQFSAFKRKSGRHGGNFFLALAFLTLIPYGFLSFDRAVSENPEWARAIRSIWPEATAYARENTVPVPAAMSLATPLENPEEAEAEIAPPLNPSDLEASAPPQPDQFPPAPQISQEKAPQPPLPVAETQSSERSEIEPNELLIRRIDELETRLKALEDLASAADPAELRPTAAQELSMDDKLERLLRILEERSLEAPPAKPVEPVPHIDLTEPPAALNSEAQ